MGGTNNFLGHDYSHGRPIRRNVSEQSVPSEQGVPSKQGVPSEQSVPSEHLSMEAYSELIAQKSRFVMTQKKLKMMVETLATIQAWCSREHETMVRTQAETDALLSEMQAPPEVSFNIVSSQGLCDKLADCINTDIATLLDDVNRVLSSTGCSTDTPFQPTRGDTDFVDEQRSFKPSKAYSQGGSEHSDGSDQCAEARGWHGGSEHSGGIDQIGRASCRERV